MHTGTLASGSAAVPAGIFCSAQAAHRFRRRAARCRGWRWPATRRGSVPASPLPGDGGAATGTSSRAGDELVGQQVAAGGEHLTELDEGDAAFFDCQPDGVGQAGATIRGAELGPASAPQVGEKAATHENSAYLRVALGPAQAVARPAGEIEGAWRGAARDECLGDYEECDTDEERDCHAEDDNQRTGRMLGLFA
jgi:hypothetical protein